MALNHNECLRADFVQHDASFRRATYYVEIPAKFTFEHTQNPEFWKHQTKLKSGDILEIVSENGDFDCECRVVSADRGYAILRVLREWHAPVEAQAEAGAAHVAAVPGKGFVLFDANGMPMASFATKDDAEKALSELGAPAREAA